MTMQPVYPDESRFEFDKADRMRRALRMSRVSVGAMADHLRVDRNTISNWINGRSNPRQRDLRDFALRTGFPVEWLETGAVAEPGTDPDGGGVTGRYRKSHRSKNHPDGRLTDRRSLSGTAQRRAAA